jgi:hypothetical protein
MRAESDFGTRELDHRNNNGIDVRLLWNSRTDRVWISIEDDLEGESFEVDVDEGDAVDAFHHPYAYVLRRADAHPSAHSVA